MNNIKITKTMKHIYTIKGMTCNNCKASVEKYLGEVESSYGKITFTKPVAQLSETPGFWALPPSPFGSYEPAWH